MKILRATYPPSAPRASARPSPKPQKFTIILAFAACLAGAVSARPALANNVAPAPLRLAALGDAEQNASSVRRSPAAPQPEVPEIAAPTPRLAELSRADASLPADVARSGASSAAPSPLRSSVPSPMAAATIDPAPDRSAVQSLTQDAPVVLASAPATLAAPQHPAAPKLLTRQATPITLSVLRDRAKTMILKTKVEDFSFYLPGDIRRGTSPTGGDKGALDDLAHAPWIRFPVEKGPAYVNSQVWGWGGHFGLGGSECDRRNYSYPWRDNFCESRSWTSGACPGGIGHQGVDIRPASCDDNKHWTVAVEDGVITRIGSYAITLKGASGYEYKYLHVNTQRAAVKRRQKVKAGDRIALISNFYNDTPTSIHLHFEMRRPTEDGKLELVSPYASLIQSYMRHLTGDAEKAAAALREAKPVARPTEPPPFKGYAGKGARRGGKVAKAKPLPKWCGFAGAERRLSALRKGRGGGVMRERSSQSACRR